MLERAAGLPERALQAIAELERRVIAADGGRLKLDWGTLRGRTGDRVEDLLWWKNDRLLGFLGLFSFGSAVELSGMVDPAARRRGIATALLNTAAQVWHERGAERVLLIVPRSSAAGRHLALARGGTLDHAEHALVLSHRPAGEGRDDTLGVRRASDGRNDALSVRRATTADVPVVARLLELGFGEPATEVADLLKSPRHGTLVIELSGSPVGTMRVTRDGDDAAIYAFAIDPARQGRGIGRDALRRVCQQLLDDGAAQVRLEVAVENDRALRLYTSLGFVRVATEDYYALKGGRSAVEPGILG